LAGGRKLIVGWNHDLVSSRVPGCFSSASVNPRDRDHHITVSFPPRENFVIFYKLLFFSVFIISAAYSPSRRSLSSALRSVSVSSPAARRLRPRAETSRKLPPTKSNKTGTDHKSALRALKRGFKRTNSP